ncbi:hypothetical protein GCM10029976_053520 [Kribbella albertanoniae]|uniref:Uncharacterized protein n=1 Tax=Kribbella albertanoniae TaxID=1266829 RepID=A0A4R4PSJ5_9ACTN|nr:hypothetical protein [Kribbella albertanoniae]TDC25330.1 hypothetical protein E1261_24485 [Kribbella albertanoniae]
MNDDPVTITLTHDQALVLSDWLYEAMMKSDRLGSIITDRAVWSPIYTITGALDTTLPELFAADYADRLAAARARLLVLLGPGDASIEEAPEP